MADQATIEITGLEERIRQLGEASTNNPMMQRRIREVIKQVLGRVRKDLQDHAASGLQMQTDPRSAYKAVRFAVYRKLFGGQVNILSPRNKGKGRLYEPPRKLQPKQRGGNRRTRGDRTTELMSYFGKDRGFVLRFLNAGTRVRYNGGRNGRTEEQYNTFIAHHEGRGHRGAISARNWFGGASQHQLENAANNLDKMINDIILGILY
jgi:hypothetical protein